MKKIFTTMFLVLMAVSSWAEIASGTCGENITWSLSDEGVLTIEGEGEMTYPGYMPWGPYKEQVKEVIIGNSVTTILDLAFFQYTNLSSLTIGNSVKSIGVLSFYFCKSLTSVDIPNSVETIGQSAFWDCSSVTSLKIGNSVKSIGQSAFSGLNITTLEIPNSVENVEEEAFENCTNLTSVVVSNSLKSFSDAIFAVCKKLTSVEIPDGVESIGKHAFHQCESLTSLTIPASVKSIGEFAFCGCTGLTSLTNLATLPQSTDSWAFYACPVENITLHVLPGCKAAYEAADIWKDFTIVEDAVEPGTITGKCGENLTWSLNKQGILRIDGEGEMFGYGYGDAPWFPYCEQVLEVVIGDKVTGIGDFDFEDCKAITSVTIGKSVKSIGLGAFDGCFALASITVAADNAALCSENNVIYTKDKTTLVLCTPAVKGAFVIPDGVGTIAQSAFMSCHGITSVTIPNTVKSIGYAAFNMCSGLTSLDIPNSVETIGQGAFEACTSLASVTIGSSVKSIGRFAFRVCQALKEMTCLAGDVPETDSDAFDLTPISGATLKVHASSVEAYKSATPWSGFGTITSIEATAVDAVASQNASNIWYDLSGRKAVRAGKGVMIHNGRKYVR